MIPPLLSHSTTNVRFILTVQFIPNGGNGNPNMMRWRPEVLMVTVSTCDPGPKLGLSIVTFRSPIINSDPTIE